MGILRHFVWLLGVVWFGWCPAFSQPLVSWPNGAVRNATGFETPTAVPTTAPVFTPTVIPTAAPDSWLNEVRVYSNVGPVIMGEIDPSTGNLVVKFSLIQLYFSVARGTNFWDPYVWNYNNTFRIDFFDLDETGTILGASYEDFDLSVVQKDGVSRRIIFNEGGYARAIYAVKSRDRIPGTRPGDVLMLHADYIDQWPKPFTIRHSIWRIIQPSTLATRSPFLTATQIPENIVDWAIGPGGRLCLLTSDPMKLYRLEEDGRLLELVHFDLPIERHGIMKIDYLPEDRAFYLLTYVKDRMVLYRLPEDSRDIRLVHTEEPSGYDAYCDVIASPDGRTLYILNSATQSIRVLRYSDVNDTPTPTPTQAPISPTPTPIPGWFVLDGFGGVHSSNPTVQRPVLPYLYPFDIMRDLEPDPRGRGWYMLDGYGGIHTDPYDLPKPAGLPYFGFDIARNLEVVNTGNGYEFFLLDGFGGVHSSGRPFRTGSFKPTGDEIFRDLEPNPGSGEWYILDGYGRIHSNIPKGSDIPLQRLWEWNPAVRGMVRFPDETTVMLDAYGGRHTNPFYPARDVVDGLPRDFYFPWPILWDVELVPSRWAENGR